MRNDSAIIGIYTLLLTVFVISALYFAQNIIIPITLSILITFLLAPLVTRLERWIGRIFAVTGVVILIFIVTSIIAYTLTLEFIDLTSKLPKYKHNIQTKIHTLTSSTEGSLSNLWQTVRNMEANLFPSDVEIKSLEKSNSVPTLSEKNVAINVTPAASLAATVQGVFSPLFYILWNTGLVMLLVIFMLLNREDLRAKIIRIIGQKRISTTTEAITDAGNRVSHYLLMQLIINIGFGILLTLGLYLLGIPNAELWGGLLAILRFIPYVGTWIAALIPVILSFIVSSSWLTPIFTIFLYLILDLISSNFVEPLLYGASTGVSSTALIIAVVFWTLLWGPIGLLLAVPITVCLAVIGRHVPQFEFLSILLSDEKALETHEEYYHRLLADAPNDVMTLADAYLKSNNLISLYDTVFIPLLINLEKDIRLGTIDKDKAKIIYETIREIVEDLNENSYETNRLNNQTLEVKECKVFCLSVRSEVNDIANLMLKQILEDQKLTTKIANGYDEKIILFLETYQPDIIFISDLTPALPIRTLCKNIYSKMPQTPIILGLWGAKQVDKETAQKLKLVGVEDIVVSFEDALSKIKNIC